MSLSVMPLKDFLRKHKNAAIVETDVVAVCTAFSDLRPEVDTFYFNGGIRKKLLKLKGTIPVNYKGATYNIPVEIWLTQEYPLCPPIVYVKPTSTMQIKTGRWVDINGRVDLPYLREWKYPHADVLVLLQIMSVEFGEQPPVFSKSPSPKALDTSLSSRGEYLSNKGTSDFKLTPSDEDLAAECDICRADYTLREAEAFCPNCKEYFCSECLKYHGRMTGTRNHKIFRKE